MTEQVAIVGATGLVGEELLRVFEERDFPVGRLSLYASERSAGRTLRFRGRWYPVRVLDAEQVAAHDIVFLSAGASVSTALKPVLDAGACCVYDNTSAFRLDPSVPLVVPEINASLLTAATRHVAVPNCTTILLVLALHPLHRAFGLKRVVVSTYQAISGAGRGARDELLRDTAAELGGRPVAADTFAFNARPSIGPARMTSPGVWSTGEEDKVEAETRRILQAARLSVHATCVRVPVLRAHAESVWVELRARPDLDQVREVLEGAPAVTLEDDLAAGTYPTPRAASGTDGILLGRLRPGGSAGTFSFFLAGDQLRKGAALNAVQIAEQHPRGASADAGAA